MKTSESLEKVYLLILMICSEEPFAFFQFKHLLGERKVGFHHLPHPVLYLLDLVIGHEEHLRTTVLHRLHFPDFAIEPARKRVIYRKHLVREHLAHHILQHEAQRPYICTSSVRMVISDKTDIMRIYDHIVQRLELIVDQRGKHRPRT